jgi:amino acid permease
MFNTGGHLPSEPITPMRIYKMFVPTQVPISLGLIAFCFGGIGAFPKMYTSMKERRQYPKVLKMAGTAVVTMYALVMIAGYYFYAQYTQIPVSLNIGNDLHGLNTQHGGILRSVAALGIIFNVQVKINKG